MPANKFQKLNALNFSVLFALLGANSVVANAAPTEVTCPTGFTVENYHLQPPPFPVAAADVKAGTAKIISPATKSVIIQSCISPDQIDAVKLANLRVQGSTANGILPAPIDVEGLRNMLFFDQTQSVNENYFATPAAKEGFNLRSYSIQNSVIVAVQPIKKSPNGKIVASNEVVVGVLEFGLPVSEGGCPDGQEIQSNTLKIKTATFDFRTCPLFGTAGSIEFDLISVAIRDTSAKLKPAEKNTFEFTGETLKKALADGTITLETVRHNTDDKFAINLPHATYSLSAVSDGTISTGWNYNFSYKNPAIKPTIGSVKCRHFIVTSADCK